MRVHPTLAVCLMLLADGVHAQARPATTDTVTVYRCTDAAGKVSLQDAPCAKGQAQQARQLPRPIDPPSAPVVRPAPAPAPAAAPETRTVYLAPPRPLYECVTPDGTRYTSDDGRGNPRWVPLWTLGVPAVPPRPARGEVPGPSGRPAHPAPAAHPPRHDRAWPMVAGGGSWVRDACVVLPPAEACARLRDRRAELRTRFFNAQEKERDRLRLEERALNARLDNDCGGH